MVRHAIRTATGRRGEVDRRSFIRMGVLGTAMASAMLMDRDREAGAAAMKRRHVHGAPRAAGLVAGRARARAAARVQLHTFGAFGSAMSDGFITPPIHDGMAAFDMGGGHAPHRAQPRARRGQRRPGRAP